MITKDSTDTSLPQTIIIQKLPRHLRFMQPIRLSCHTWLTPPWLLLLAGTVVSCTIAITVSLGRWGGTVLGAMRRIIEFLKDIYSLMTVHQHKGSNKINTSRARDMEKADRPSCLWQHSKAHSEDLGNRSFDHRRRIYQSPSHHRRPTHVRQYVTSH